MKKFENAAAFLVGLIFALGLGISGMTQTQKVIGFLDVFGEWDPSLLFVMAGAVGIHFVTYRMMRKQPAPLIASTWHLPKKREITPALIMGSFLFGLGWGIAGYCPGPALTSLTTLDPKPWVFVSFMILGMYLFRWMDQFAEMRR